jgi:hypothetical protein
MSNPLAAGRAASDRIRSPHDYVCNHLQTSCWVGFHRKLRHHNKKVKTNSILIFSFVSSRVWHSTFLCVFLSINFRFSQGHDDVCKANRSGKISVDNPLLSSELLILLISARRWPSVHCDKLAHRLINFPLLCSVSEKRSTLVTISPVYLVFFLLFSEVDLSFSCVSRLQNFSSFYCICITNIETKLIKNVGNVEESLCLTPSTLSDKDWVMFTMWGHCCMLSQNRK